MQIFAWLWYTFESEIRVKVVPKQERNDCFMHEILKRALDEALTAAYAGEIPVGTEEVAFSEGFEREMCNLIRKTDRPFRVGGYAYWQFH